MSENTNAGRAHDPVRDKYVHAVSWDYTSRDPQVARLRERLAAEYDGRPATPAGMDAGRFMDSSRLVVRPLFERMASHGLLAGPDGLYAAMFPFPRHAVHRRPDRHGRPVRRIAGDGGRGRPAPRIGCGRDVRHRERGRSWFPQGGRRPWRCCCSGCSRFWARPPSTGGWGSECRPYWGRWGSHGRSGRAACR